MSAIYLETSAVLAWLLGQSGAEEVLALVERSDQIVTSTLTGAETERALARAESQKALKAAEVQKLQGLYSRAQQGWIRLSVSDDVLARAGRPFPVEPVRTLDAIHLASALLCVRAIPDLRMVSLDRRIGANATALGLAD